MQKNSEIPDAVQAKGQQGDQDKNTSMSREAKNKEKKNREKKKRKTGNRETRNIETRNRETKEKDKKNAGIHTHPADRHTRVKNVRHSKKQDTILYICIFIIYTVLMAVIAHFHEPWLDEAQAWVIARDESVKNIILKIPHAEGHSPLWFLWLALFAKTGVPYEIGLPAACIIVMSASVLIFLFKSRFNRWVKIFLPFTYYFFYQNGVISREYCFSVLAFVLLACVWNDKWNKPYRTALAMVLLCFSSPYGLVFAFGLGIVWLYDLISAVRRKAGDVHKNMRNIVTALVILVVSAGVLVLDLIPVADTTALNVEAENPLPVRLLYMFFVSVPDTLLTSVFSDDMYLKICEYQAPVMAICAVIGAILYAYVFLVLPKANGHRREFMIPYAIYALFAANVYYSTHHLCMTAAFLLFWCWLCEERHAPYQRSFDLNVSKQSDRKGQYAKQRPHMKRAYEASGTQIAENPKSGRNASGYAAPNSQTSAASKEKSEAAEEKYKVKEGSVSETNAEEKTAGIPGSKRKTGTSARSAGCRNAKTSVIRGKVKQKNATETAEYEKRPETSKRTGKSETDILRAKLVKAVPVLTAVCIVIPLFWNTSACIKEIRNNYSTSKGYTDFIKKNGLADAKIFMSADMIEKKGGKKLPELSDCPLPILTAYFPQKNNIYKFNIGGKDIQYVYPVEESEKDDENTLKEWREAGYPDIVIGEASISMIFGDDPEDQNDDEDKSGYTETDEKNSTNISSVRSVKNGKSGKTEKTGKAEKAEKTGENEKTGKIGKSGKTEKTGKAEKAEKTGESEKTGKIEKSGKTEKTGKFGNIGKSEKTGKTEKSGNGVNVRSDEGRRGTPEYICVWVGKAAKIYKNFQFLPPIAGAKKVYMRKELAEEKGIKQVHWEKME